MDPHEFDLPIGKNDFRYNEDTSILLRKLKVLGKFLNHMEENIKTDTTEWKGNELALHLAHSNFISHSNDGVRQLVAYAVTHVLRIRLQKHPYAPQELNNILLFLINEIKGLAHENEVFRKCQESVLEMLAEKDLITVFKSSKNLAKHTVHLFSTITEVVHSSQSMVVQGHLVNILGHLVEELPAVPLELFREIIIHCRSSNKMQNKAAYGITVLFIRKFKHALGPTFAKVMNDELFGTFERNRSDGIRLSPSCWMLCKRWMTRLWKMHSICSDITIPVMLHLESALITLNCNYRALLVSFLGRLFGTPHPTPMYKECSALWKAFLGRFRDIDLNVRVACLDQVPLLFRIQELRSDLVWVLGDGEMDTRSTVRAREVSLVFSLIKDYGHLDDDAVQKLFPVIEQRRLDPEVNVRLSALESMAELYTFFSENGEKRDTAGFRMAMKTVSKYPTYVLLHYWIHAQRNVQDRIIVIQLLYKYIVPIDMQPKERMIRLLKVLATLDHFTCTTFLEVRYQQHLVRTHILKTMTFVKEKNGRGSRKEKEALLNAMAICPCLPVTPTLALEIVMSFALKVTQDEECLDSVTKILLCESTFEEFHQVMEKLQRTRKHSAEFHLLLEWASDLLFDSHSFKTFVCILDEFLQGETDFLDDFELEAHTTIENSLLFLEGLAASSPSYFYDENLISIFISWLRNQDDRIHPTKLHALKILTDLQPDKDSLLLEFPEAMDGVIALCEDLCFESNTSLGKWAIRCLLISESLRERLVPVVLPIVQNLCNNINSRDLSRSFCSIYYLGYIFSYMAKYLVEILPKIISDEVAHDIMSRDGEESSREITWSTWDALSIETQIKIRFIKFFGQCANQECGATRKILSFLFHIIEAEGHYPNGITLSNIEASWLRLEAGCSVIGILIGRPITILTCHQFFLLSNLMNDDVAEVRERFFKKLTSGLTSEFPQVSMPVELLSIYVLADVKDSDFEDIEQSHVISKLSILFPNKLNAMNWYSRSQLYPENYSTENHVFVYALLALTFGKIFSNPTSEKKILQMKKRVSFFLYLLLLRNGDSRFYQKQVQMIKKHKIKGGDMDISKKLWILCDIALILLERKIESTSKMDKMPTLPMMFFEPKPINNSKKYLTAKVLKSLSQDSDEASDDEENNEEEKASGSVSSEEGIEDGVVVVGEGELPLEEDYMYPDDTSDLEEREEETPHQVDIPLHTRGRKRKATD